MNLEREKYKNRRTMKNLYLIALLMCPLLQADLRYNHKKLKYYSTHSTIKMSKSEYHVLALMVKRAINLAYDNGLSMTRTIDEIIVALFDNGSEAALQLIYDLKLLY